MLINYNPLPQYTAKLLHISYITLPQLTAKLLLISYIPCPCRQPVDNGHHGLYKKGDPDYCVCDLVIMLFMDVGWEGGGGKEGLKG